jgi:hypothetical protein
MTAIHLPDLKADRYFGEAHRFHPINHDDIVALKTKVTPEGTTGRLRSKLPCGKSECGETEWSPRIR